MKLRGEDCVEAASSKAGALAPMPKSAALSLMPRGKLTPRDREREFLTGNLHVPTGAPQDRERDVFASKKEGTNDDGDSVGKDPSRAQPLQRELEANLVDFDADETWDQQVERRLKETAANYYEEYPVSALRATDRRAWERFAKDLKKGILPSTPMLCSWRHAKRVRRAISEAVASGRSFW
jgi:hypothetical protein